MAKPKSKRSGKPTAAGRTGKVLLPGWWKGLSSAGRWTLLLTCMHVVLLGGLAGGIYFGLRTADSYVRRLDRYHGPIQVVLRAKSPKGDVLVTTREIKESSVPAGAAVICKSPDRGGQTVVERDGKSISLPSDDLQPDWLARFAYVRTNVVKRAEALANDRPPADNSPDWFDATMAGRIAAAVEADPYVGKGGVVQVEKELLPADGGPQSFTRQIVVTVALRRPVAHIFVGAGGYLLDATGVVLERRDNLIKRTDGSLEIPQIADFQVDPRWLRQPGLPPGTPLNAPDIQAGLDLLVKLAGQPFYGEITEVNLDNFKLARPRDSQLVLKARSIGALPQQAIGWGLLRENSFERNNTADKIQILNDIYAEYRRLNLQDLELGPYDLWREPHKARWPKSTMDATPAPAAPAAPMGSRGGHLAGRTP